MKALEEGQRGVARKLRRSLTTAEQRLWLCLRNRQIAGAKFRRQFPLGRYVVDFCCLEAGLVIEVDGGQHAERQAEDVRRTRDLEELGYRVLRFWNNEVFGQTDAVLEQIRRTVEEARRSGKRYSRPASS